jgi:Cation/multidrug efflux pump
LNASRSKPGRNVYLRDVGTVADATDLNYGYALVDGRKSLYLPIIKKNTASTLQVVADVHKAMPAFKERAARRRGGQLRVRRIADRGHGREERGDRRV